MILDSHCIPISSQIKYKIALNLISFYVVSDTAPPASLSCFFLVTFSLSSCSIGYSDLSFFSTLLALFVQPWMSIGDRNVESNDSPEIFCVPRRAEGPWGRDPLNTSDLWSGTLFPSLSGIHHYSLLLSQNWNPISSLLHTDLSFSSRCTNQSLVMHRCICSVCGMWERVCVCLRVCVMKWTYLYSMRLCKQSGFLWDRAS